MHRKVLFVLAIFVFVIACAIAGCHSKTTEELYSEGVQQIKAGNPGGAIVLLKNALEKNPNHQDSRYQLAKAYAALGKYEHAEREFKKVALQSPGRDEIKLDLARVHCFIKKPELAIAEANEFLKNHPGSPEALEILGMASFISNKPGDAENYLLQSLKFDPSRVSAKLNLARVYAKEGKTKETKDLLNEAITNQPKNSTAYYMLASIEAAEKNYKGALDIYNKLISLNPADITAKYKSALMYLHSGNRDYAMKIAGELITDYPKRPEGYRLKGIISFYDKNFKEAIPNLQQSLKIQPTVDGYYFLGLSHYNLGELENALSQFRIIIDHSPSFVQARVMTAVIFLTQKRTDDSINELNNILKIDDNNAIAHNLLGSAYMTKGLYDEGLKELNRALELDPKLVDAHVKKGVYHLRKGNVAEGESALHNAVSIKPELLNTRLMLFSHYMSRNDKVKALSVVQEGISGKKEDAVFYNCMAAVKFSDSKPSEAMNYLQKAKNADPAFFPSYFNMATFYTSSGDYGKALGEYGAVLQKEPKNLKAMLSSGATLELMGKDKEALDWYNKAKASKTPAAFMVLANYHLRKKDKGKAISVLNEANNAIPRNVKILEMEGRIYLSEKKYREAIKIYDNLESISPDLGIPPKIATYMAMKDYPKATEQARRVISLKPYSSFGYRLLASVYEGQNKVDQAIYELKNGLSREKDNLQTLLMLGKLYIKKKDLPMASTTFNEAVKKNPDSPLALFSLGSFLETNGKKEEAVMKYRQALAKSENFVPALNNLANLYVDGFGSKKEGLRLAISAFKLEPGNGGVMDTVGYALIKNGRAAESRKILEKAASILPENPTVQYHLALACKETGDIVQAKAALHKALQKGGFPEEKEARALLADLK